MRSQNNGRPQVATITATAYAKINWTLDVLSRRDDGYHNIASIMQRIKLADFLTFSRGGQEVTLTVTGPEAAGVPDDDRNIVARAAGLLSVSGVKIEIEKNIPNQAGLGGGSSDCAAALSALNTLFDLDINSVELMALGARLGADVPFFLQSRTALIDGFGEAVTPIKQIDPVALVLLKSEVGVSTKDAYEALGRLDGRQSYNATARWPEGGPANDFEDVIYSLYPQIGEARTALKSAGAQETLLCGSGSTVMGWGGDLRQTAENLRGVGYDKIWLTQTI